jgi:potassium voltage-gated channel Eag-related subfamily H protein 7
VVLRHDQSAPGGTHFLDAPGSAERPEELNDDHGWSPDVVEESDHLGSLMTKVRREIERKLENGSILDQKMMGDITNTKYTQHRCCRSLSPLGEDMKRWDVVTVMLLGFTALVTPFEIAFLETSIDGLFFVNRVVDLGFLWDLIINFRLAYMDDVGQYQFDPAKIRLHYLKGWFCLDFVSLIPWDCISMLVKASSASGSSTAASSSDLKMLRLLKILKLTKMVRILKSARVFKRMQTDLGINNTNKQLIKYLFLIIAAMHWTACGWGMVATYSETVVITDASAYYDNSTDTTRRILKGASGTTTATSSGDGNDSWIRRFEDRENEGERLPIADVFALCLEYALAVMCMGYATVAPETSAERWFSLCMMLFAGSVYAYVIGGICSAVAAEDGAALEFKENMDTLMLFFRNISLPEELKMRAYEYLNYCENMFRDESHRDVLMLMPPSIRGDICIHQHSKLVHQIPFFQKCFMATGAGKGQSQEQTKLLSIICLKLSQKAYPPREVVYLRNDPATDVFIITRGVVKISGGFIKVPQYLSAGQNFGSDMLMTPEPQRVHAVKSVSFSTHAVLAAEDLFELQESKAYLFEIASKSMRLHRNILKCAYTMQKFGRMVRREVKKEIEEMSCTKEEAVASVTARYHSIIHSDGSNDENGKNRLLAEKLASRMALATPKGPPARSLPSRAEANEAKEEAHSAASLLRQTKIAVNGSEKDRVTADELGGLMADASTMPLTELFELQQKVLAQSAEWAELEARLSSAIQLRVTKEVDRLDRKAKSAASDNGKRRKSFAE